MAEMTKAERLLIEHRVKNLKPEQIEGFLRNACEENFTPGLSLEVFEGLVAKCSPEALQLMRDRLTARGSTEALARLQAIIDQDPDRK